MASKSLTLKFGADTGKLTKALRRMRQQVTGSIGGAMRFATSLRGMALAGVGGFGASQGISAMMNLSPRFADAMLKLSEPLERLARIIGDQLAPHIITLADFLERYLGQAGNTIADIGGAPSSVMSAPGVGFSVRGMMLPGLFPNEAIPVPWSTSPTQSMSHNSARKVGQ